jgi:hypothetical protein
MMIAEMPLRRASRRLRCPICGRPDWCEIDEAGGWVHRMRTPNDRPGRHRGGGWWHPLPGALPTTAGGASPPRCLPAVAPTVRSRVYHALLAHCPLDKAHHAYLVGPACRLPESELAGYGTLPPARRQEVLLQVLLTTFRRDTLLGVPGLVPSRAPMLPGLCIAGCGLLIGVRDADGLLVGCQVRREGGGYLWLSSVGAGGPSPGTPAHVVRRGSGHTVWLTEGAKKAHIAALVLECTVIGLSGHANHASGAAALAALRADGAGELVIALDDDDRARPVVRRAVQRSRQVLAREASRLGYAVWMARWRPEQGKGIDDLLLGGGRPSVRRYRLRSEYGGPE